MDRHARIDQLFAAMSGRDLAALEALLTPDAELLFPKTGPLRGRDRVLKFLRILFRRFGELVFEVERVIIQGDDAAVHWTNRGRRADGGDYANEGVTLCRFEGERFALLSDFFKDTEAF